MDVRAGPTHDGRNDPIACAHATNGSSSRRCRGRRPLARRAWWAILLAARRAPGRLRRRDGRCSSARSRTAGRSAAPLAFMGVVFVLLQVLASDPPGGQREPRQPYRRLAPRPPHARVRAAARAWLTSSGPALTNDLTMARDFDLGITGPPLAIAMDFIAIGLVDMVGGHRAGDRCSPATQWWAAARRSAARGLATHWLLRESSIWRDRNTDEVRNAQRHAEYTYRLAVDAPASKEVRLFGLADWVVERFVGRRRRLFELQWRADPAARAVGARGAWCSCSAPTRSCSGRSPDAATSGEHHARRSSSCSPPPPSARARSRSAGSAGRSTAPRSRSAAALRLEPAMAPIGALAVGSPRPADRMPAREIRVRDLTFAYDTDERPVLDGFDLTIPAGTLARDRRPERRGQDDAREAAVPALRPAARRDRGRRRRPPRARPRRLAVARHRRVPGLHPVRVVAARQRRARRRARRRRPRGAGRGRRGRLAGPRHRAGAGLRGRHRPLGRAVATRRARPRAVRGTLGAGVVLLDEPTAQLDVRGEAEIFDRILAATRDCTTILVSHRFSTVRHADRICVLEGGRVVELGTHDELMARGGRYRTMFDLQASRFGARRSRRGGVL